MTNNDRQQRMAERILEDENLRGDLEDEAATALVDWASKRAAAAAADPARPDDVVEAQVQAIRQAARAAARSGESDPRQLIALAEARLAPDVAPGSEPAVGTPSAAPVVTSNTAEPSEVPAASAAPLAQPTAAARSVGEEPAVASQAGNAPSGSVSSPQPAGAAAPRPRRKRNRLARFLKRARGER